ncbi:helix-turn-helix domain-containing protein [Streptomyces microflavus]|uniref:helix-turn-helix domain-containing protein n=1 Tax=Streptomyces microflavus TaxID=1919 RepID=UPI00381214EF
MKTQGLSDEERAALEGWVRRRSTPHAVGRWRARFVEHRIAGLGDMPRSGGPRTVTDEQVAALVTRTLESAPKNTTHWSTRSMAKQTGLSQSTVSRIKLNREVPDALDIHLVLDDYATHKTPAIKTWLLAHPRFHLHFTPTGSPWLNLVQRWFAELTGKQIRRGVRTKTADEILERLASYPNRIPDSEG